MMQTKFALLKQYKKIPIQIKAAAWFAAMSVLQKGIQFLVTPIYTRLLTTEEYGYYSIYTSWSSILLVIATLNLHCGVFNNGMLKYADDRRRYISSMQGLGNITTILVFSILFLFRDLMAQWSGLDISILFGMFLVMMFNPSFSYWSQYQRYIYAYRTLSCVTLISAILIPAISVTLVWGLPERKYAVILGNVIVQTAIGLIYYVFNLLKGKKLYVKKYWLFALKFNIPLIPHYLSSIVLGQADRIMINYYFGESAVGIYSLTYSISLLLNVFVNAINSTFVPWTYQSMSKKDYKRIGQLANYVLMLLGGITICGILLAPEMIAFLGTEEYMQAQWIVAPVMLSGYFTMLYSFFANVEFYYEKSVGVMLASVVAAVSNVILNAIFIPMFGFIAAGYTTMVSYILLALMHYVLMKRVCKDQSLPSIYNIKFIVSFSIGMSLVSLLLMATYNFALIRYTIIVLVLVTAVVLRNKIITLLKMLKGRTAK